MAKSNKRTPKPKAAKAPKAKRKHNRGRGAVAVQSWHLQTCVERLDDAVMQLASHDQRLTAQNSATLQIQTDIRELRGEQTRSVEVVNSRIDGVRMELSNRLEDQTKALTSHFDTGILSLEESRKKDTERLASLEKWRFLIGGGAAVASVAIFDVLARIFSAPIGQFVMKFYTH